MQFDYSKLRGRIRELNMRIEDCADASGIARSSFNLKINGHYGFRQEEILAICDALGIPYEQIHLYFFQVKKKGLQEAVP